MGVGGRLGAGWGQTQRPAPKTRSVNAVHSRRERRRSDTKGPRPKFPHNEQQARAIPPREVRPPNANDETRTEPAGAVRHGHDSQERTREIANNIKKEFVKIMKFWLEKGVAGFRFDAAKHIFDQNELPNGTANMSLNKDFWVELRNAARKIKPNVFFIGEVLNKQIPSIGPYAPGFDSLWDFATEDILAASVGSGSTASLLKTLKRNVDGLTKYDDFVPSYLLSNHDMDRSISVILSKCGVNATDGLAITPEDPIETVQAKKLALTRAKTAASLYHTLPGLPWVYYGEELGITGIRYANNDISRRDSMIWTKDRKLSPKWQNKHQMV